MDRNFNSFECNTYCHIPHAKKPKNKLAKLDVVIFFDEPQKIPKHKLRQL